MIPSSFSNCKEPADGVNQQLSPYRLIDYPPSKEPRALNSSIDVGCGGGGESQTPMNELFILCVCAEDVSISVRLKQSISSITRLHQILFLTHTHSKWHNSWIPPQFSSKLNWLFCVFFSAYLSGLGVWAVGGVGGKIDKWQQLSDELNSVIKQGFDKSQSFRGWKT